MDREEAYKHARKPAGQFGKEVVLMMNQGHAGLTDWGLSLIRFQPCMVMLDIGCGGGRTLQRLAALSPGGSVHGLDYSQDCVDVSIAQNRTLVDAGRVHVMLGNVARIPFEENTFNLVTAVETFFFWPDLPHDFSEVRRVLQPGGVFALISESYTDPRFDTRNAEWERKAGYRNYSPREMEILYNNAGFLYVKVQLVESKNWITVTGTK
jgi:ubiquinone/menaquinone biosynthesis C-methylase UbiE